MLSAYSRTDAFVDGFNFTAPKDSSQFTRQHLLNFLHEYGFSLDGQGSLIAPNFGLIRISHRHMVCSYHVNGLACSYLRMVGAFDLFLGCIYQLDEYRITRADLTVDITCHAPDYLDRIDLMLLDGCLKFPDGKAAVHNGRPIEYTEKKERSGGLYFNSRKAERCGKVYDKALERLTRTREIIPPTLRIELTLSNKLGLSIVDLKNPAPLFYHHLPPALMTKPPEVPSWEPWADVAGFTIEKRQRTSGERLKAILEAIQPQIEKASAIIEKESSAELRKYFMSRLAEMLGGGAYA